MTDRAGWSMHGRCVLDALYEVRLGWAALARGEVAGALGREGIAWLWLGSALFADRAWRSRDSEHSRDRARHAIYQLQREIVRVVQESDPWPVCSVCKRACPPNDRTRLKRRGPAHAGCAFGDELARRRAAR